MRYPFRPLSVAVAAAVLFAAVGARAATFTVTTLADSGAGSAERRNGSEGKPALGFKLGLKLEFSARRRASAQISSTMGKKSGAQMGRSKPPVSASIASYLVADGGASQPAPPAVIE